jgi:phosphoribosylformimino-5-aminoimidazole carboxamide ribotide isomerase
VRDWTVFPAIDLRRGRVVRLQQGDPASETEYSTEPQSVAAKWQTQGAQWVHVVDLDGALGEDSQGNLCALGRIVETGLEVQYGGGIRTLDSIRLAASLSVSRVVIGTAAIENRALVASALETLGSERVAVAIDVHGQRVRTRGWTEESNLSPTDLAQRLAVLGVKWVIYTDISRDGMGSGLNTHAAAAMAQEYRFGVIASGGICSLADIVRAHEVGLSGVVIGRALYEGMVSLPEALGVGKERPIADLGRAPRQKD